MTADMMMWHVGTQHTRHEHQHLKVAMTVITIPEEALTIPQEEQHSGESPSNNTGSFTSTTWFAAVGCKPSETRQLQSAGAPAYVGCWADPDDVRIIFDRDGQANALTDYTSFESQRQVAEDCPSLCLGWVMEWTSGCVPCRGDCASTACSRNTGERSCDEDVHLYLWDELIVQNEVVDMFLLLGVIVVFALRHEQDRVKLRLTVPISTIHASVPWPMVWLQLGLLAMTVQARSDLRATGDTVTKEVPASRSSSRRMLQTMLVSDDCDWEHHPRRCETNDHMLAFHPNIATVTECSALCFSTAGCVAFEFGVDYGGTGATISGQYFPPASPNDCVTLDSREIVGYYLGWSHFDYDCVDLNTDLYLMGECGCTQGEYDHDLNVSTPCRVCDAGNETDTLEIRGATACAPCSPGTADMDLDSSTACAMCPFNTYSHGYSATECLRACDTGFYPTPLLAQGATSNDCLAIPSTGFPMTNELLFLAITECKVESSRHMGTEMVARCTEWSYDGCDATYECPISQAQFGRISQFDVSEVTSFNCAVPFIENWCLPAQLGNSAGLFCKSFKFNEDLSHWNTSSSTCMAGMFNGAKSFSGSVGSWNVTGVVNFDSMFYDTRAFASDLSSWLPTAAENMGEMFAESAMHADYGCDWGDTVDSSGNTITNCRGDPWGVAGVDTNSMFSSSCLEDMSLTTPLALDWSCEPECIAFNTTFQNTPVGYVIPTPSATTVSGLGARVCADGYDGYPIVECYGDTFSIAGCGCPPGEYDHDSDVSTPCLVCGPGSYTDIVPLRARGATTCTPIPRTGFPMTNRLVFAAVLECKVESRVDSSFSACSYWGSYDMCDATYECKLSQQTYGHISTFDVSAVTSFRCHNEGSRPQGWCPVTHDGDTGLFSKSTNFNLDISRWNTSSCVDMVEMFHFASSFSGNLESWNVTSVVRFTDMFHRATSFGADLSSWQPTAAVDMSLMFYESAMMIDYCADGWNQSEQGSCGPWGVTGVDTSDMYSSGCLAGHLTLNTNWLNFCEPQCTRFSTTFTTTPVGYEVVANVTTVSDLNRRCANGYEGYPVVRCTGNEFSPLVGCGCPPGEYDHDADVSTPCLVCDAPGSSTDTALYRGATTCTLCVQGKADTDSDSSTSCVDCAAGTYSTAVGATECDTAACAAGSYSASGSASLDDCIICADGTADEDNDPSTPCLGCSAGAPYSNAMRTGCISTCRPGTRPTAAITYECTQCDEGQVSTLGVCEWCADRGANYVANEEQTFCEACTPGRAPKLDLSACESCNGANYSADGSACTECPAPNVVNGDHTTCSVCAPGTGPSDEQTNCTACTNTTVSPFGIACIKCSAGIPNQKRTNCQKCGPYQHANANGDACECQAKFYNSTSSWLQCIEGNRGFEPQGSDDEDHTCQLCPSCATCETGVAEIRHGYTELPHQLLTSSLFPEGIRVAFRCDVRQSTDDVSACSAESSGPRCSSGSTGYFCQSCGHGYHSVDDVCERCGTASTGTSLTVVFCFAAVVACGVSMWWSNPECGCGKPDDTSTEQNAEETQNPVAAENVQNLAAPRALRDTIGTYDDQAYAGQHEVAKSTFCAVLRSQSFRTVLRAIFVIVFQPIRMVITWAQVTSQIGAVLHVQYPPIFASSVEAFRFVNDAFSVLWDSECFDLGGYPQQWLVKIIMLPLLVCILYIMRMGADFGERRIRKDDDLPVGRSKAKRHFTGDFFAGTFLLYPTICNTTFAAFQCRELIVGGAAVLEVDDTLMCSGDETVVFFGSMQTLRVASVFIIVVVAAGVPLTCIVVLTRLANRYNRTDSLTGTAAPPQISETSKKAIANAIANRLAKKFSVDEDVAESIIHDVTHVGQDFGFLVDAYSFRHYYWEALDLLRKLVLVGLVLMVGRGSVAQSIVALILSFGFFALQVRTWPYKLQQDNLLRAATEMHVFLVIAVALALHGDLRDEQVSEGWYDVALFLSFLVLVPGACAAAVISKALEFFNTLTDDSPQGTFDRVCLGLASDKDRVALEKCINDIRASEISFALEALDPKELERLGTALHTAVDSKEFREVLQELLAQGADAAFISRSGITPLHRAARVGDVEIIDTLLGAATCKVDAQTAYGYTALHLACANGHTSVAKQLIAKGCDTALTNYREKTAWEIASLRGQSDPTAAALERLASDESDDQHAALRQEQHRRLTQPDVIPTREDLQLNSDRFGFWGFGEVHEEWRFIAEGGFGKVYLTSVFPPIQGAGGSRYHQVAIKAAKTGANGELKGETEGLAQLSHKHIVSILGFTYCLPAVNEQESWLMVLEYCQSDLEKLLYGDEPKGVMYAVEPREQRSPRKLMVKLSLQVSHGMQYLHRAQSQHLDLKPENVLLRRVGGTEAQPEWEAKIADFGMDADDLQAGKDHQAAVAADKEAASGSHNKMWLGTFEYMSPEATGKNRGKFGNAGAAADVFSFGVMLWEMLFGMRVRKGMTTDAVADTQTIAVWMYNGRRPEIPESYAPPLRHLMEACWREMPADRVDFQVIVPALEALFAADKLGKLVAESEESELSFDDLMALLGLAEKKDALADYLEVGNELRDLKQMDADDLDADILNDEDLGLDEDTKAKFRTAVTYLASVTGSTSVAGLASALGATATPTATATACDALVAWIRTNVGQSEAQAMQAVRRDSQGDNLAMIELQQRLDDAEAEVKRLKSQ